MCFNNMFFGEFAFSIFVRVDAAAAAAVRASFRPRAACKTCF